MNNKLSARMLVVLCGLVLVAVCESPSAWAQGKGPSAGTVSETKQVLDLTTIPLVKGANTPKQASYAKLTYTIPGTADHEAYVFHRDQLVSDGWTQDQGLAITAPFRKDGYVVTLATSILGGGVVTVEIQNHGNVDFARLPLPPGSKELVNSPNLVSFRTPLDAAAAKKALQKSLPAKGWQPYGAEKDALYFKQNAVRLEVKIGSAQKKGQCTINFKPEMLAHDLPAPLDATELKYADATGKLTFNTKSKPEAVAEFYMKELNKMGWKSEAKMLTKAMSGQTMTFENPEDAPLTLLVSTAGAATRVELQHEQPKKATP